MFPQSWVSHADDADSGLLHVAVYFSFLTSCCLVFFLLTLQPLFARVLAAKELSIQAKPKWLVFWPAKRCWRHTLSGILESRWLPLSGRQHRLHWPFIVTVCRGDSKTDSLWGRWWSPLSAYDGVFRGDCTPGKASRSPLIFTLLPCLTPQFSNVASSSCMRCAEPFVDRSTRRTNSDSFNPQWQACQSRHWHVPSLLCSLVPFYFCGLTLLRKTTHLRRKVTCCEERQERQERGAGE